MADTHISRCMKRLKEWGAPLDGWYCTKVIDVRDDDPEAPLEICELCDYDGIRYVHKMENTSYFEPVYVGCICAGIMEQDIFAAKERERLLRNRASRKKRFSERFWIPMYGGSYRKEYKGKSIWVVPKDGGYEVQYRHKRSNSYKGKAITNLVTANYAAFELIDQQI